VSAPDQPGTESAIEDAYFNCSRRAAVHIFLSRPGSPISRQTILRHAEIKISPGPQLTVPGEIYERFVPIDPVS
jgi:hypothetical protein